METQETFSTNNVRCCFNKSFFCMAILAFVLHATVACCRKKVEIIQLSCDIIQQSHAAQISPFTQRDFVACRMFLSHRVNAP